MFCLPYHTGSPSVGEGDEGQVVGQGYVWRLQHRYTQGEGVCYLFKGSQT